MCVTWYIEKLLICIGSTAHELVLFVFLPINAALIIMISKYHNLVK
jgi:hypothetical protein